MQIMIIFDFNNLYKAFETNCLADGYSCLSPGYIYLGVGERGGV